MVAPANNPTAAGQSSRTSHGSSRVRPTPRTTTAAANPLSRSPSRRSDEKKPGPNWSPMVKTKRISPNSRTNPSSFSSRWKPQWPNRRPEKSTPVVPNLSPRQRQWPMTSPLAMTTASNRMAKAAGSEEASDWNNDIVKDPWGYLGTFIAGEERVGVDIFSNLGTRPEPGIPGP